MGESPEYIRTSLAAALTLGFEKGLFYRDARLYCINLLLTYESGCAANCAYCGLSKIRPGSYTKKSFIRVKWPVYPTCRVVERMGELKDGIKRVCISMVTRRRAVKDTLTIIREIREKTDIPISCLISPTVTSKQDLEEMKREGADKIGIAIDAGNEKLFDNLRGRGVKGPHRWERYWECFEEAIQVFGEGNVGSHFIVGLGETERELLYYIQKIKNMGGETHLFSFFPEENSLLSNLSPPPISVYRRVQLGRYLIDEGVSRFERMRFDDKGRVIDFGMDVGGMIEKGEPFMTSGCKGKDGRVACNRPYANERPSQEIRNFPFPPTQQDIEQIKKEIWSYTP